jgi:hypothetical protein
MRFTSLTLLPLAGGLAGAALGLTVPQVAQAEKERLPVECSGRYTDCFERKLCTRYNSEHACIERTTEMWHYYPTKP